jgi:hypothetical protein
MFTPQTLSFNPLSRMPLGMGWAKFGYRLARVYFTQAVL